MFQKRNFVAIRRPKADFGSYFEGILHFFSKPAKKKFKKKNLKNK